VGVAGNSAASRVWKGVNTAGPGGRWMFTSVGLSLLCLTASVPLRYSDTDTGNVGHYMCRLSDKWICLFGPLLTVMRTQKAQVEACWLFLGFLRFWNKFEGIGPWRKTGAGISRQDSVIPKNIFQVTDVARIRLSNQTASVTTLYNGGKSCQT
jgi:hypothetical protein